MLDRVWGVKLAKDKQIRFLHSIHVELSKHGNSLLSVLPSHALFSNKSKHSTWKCITEECSFIYFKNAMWAKLSKHNFHPCYLPNIRHACFRQCHLPKHWSKISVHGAFEIGLVNCCCTKNELTSAK